MTVEAQWQHFQNLFSRHRFQDNGERNRPHHFTEYFYPDNLLIRKYVPTDRPFGPRDFVMRLNRPHDQETRIEPGPKPASRDDCMYFSITEAVAQDVPKHFIQKERDMQTLYQHHSGYPDHVRLENDMDRVSKYWGKTWLGLLFGHYQLLIKRISVMNFPNQGSEGPIREEEEYRLKLSEWPELGSRLKSQTGLQGQPLKVWWERLETLRLAKTDRAYHSVSHDLESSHKLEYYKRIFNIWKTPPIDAFLTSVGPEQLGKSEEDKRCLICFDDLEFKGLHQAVRLPCSHVFGRQCIKKWIEDGRPPKNCPFCRTNPGKPPPPPPPPTFNLNDSIVTIKCDILVTWYNEFKAKEEASTYSEPRFNPIFCKEVGIMEAFFREVLPPEEGKTCISPHHFSTVLQNAIAAKLRELLQLSNSRALRDYLFPGFETLVGRVCDGMAFRLRDEANALGLRNKETTTAVLNEDEDEIL